MSVMTTVETERLILRPFRDSDTDEYAEMSADTDVMRFLGGPMARDMAWRHMATIVGHWVFRGYGFWAVELRETGEFLGRLGCWKPEGWPALEVGWALKKSAWGKGYATEGAAASLDYAFDRLGAERMISLIHPDNTPSQAVAKRLGERLDGEAQIFGLMVGVWAITKEEWLSQSSQRRRGKPE